MGGCGGYNTRIRTGKTRQELLEDDSVMGVFGKDVLAYLEVPSGPGRIGMRAERWRDVASHGKPKSHLEETSVSNRGWSGNGCENSGGVDYNVRAHLEIKCPCGGDLSRHVIDENGMAFIRPPMKRPPMKRGAAEDDMLEYVGALLRGKQC